MDFGLYAKENVLDFPQSVLRQECGLREHSLWQLGRCDQYYCAFITGRERLREVPRNKRLGSTIHLQTNNLYAV